MSAPRFLNVFLRGRHIGELRGKDLKLSFQYDRAKVLPHVLKLKGKRQRTM